MALKKPSLEQLFELADKLTKAYPDDDAQRLSFIALLKQATADARKMHPREAHKLLFSLITLEYDAIVCDYNWMSPMPGFLFGSKKFKLLTEYLGINKDNPYSEFERLPYIYHAQQYIKSVYSDADFAILQQRAKNEGLKLIWKNREEIIHFTEKAIDRHTDKYKSNVKKLKNSVPELEALRETTKEWGANYIADVKAKKSWWPAQPEHLLSETVSLLHEACVRLYEGNPKNPDDDSRAREAEAHESVLFVQLLRTYKKYHFTSPEGGVFNAGSSRYRVSKKGFHIDFLALSVEEQLKLLRVYSQLLIKINRSSYFYEEKKAEWKRLYGAGVLEKKLEQLITEVTRLTETVNEIGNQASLKGMAASATVGYGIQTVGKQFVTNGLSTTAEYVGVNLLGITGIAAGPFTLGISAAAGVTTLGISYLLRNTPIGRVVLEFCSAGIDVFSGAAGDKAVDMIGYVFGFLRSNPTTLYSMREQFKAEDDQVFCDWINTLLKLPERNISAELKKELRTLVGIKEGEEMKPIERVIYRPKTLFSEDNKKCEINIQNEDYDPAAAGDKEKSLQAAAADENHLFLRT